MLRRALLTLLAAGMVLAAVPAATASAHGRPAPLTVAVFGDSPYGRTAYAPGNQSGDTVQLVKTPAFVDAINADPSVREVINAGDIHSGKDFCTAAWDQDIAAKWQAFQRPVVYTPGDNEWADCHKATSLAKPGEGGGFYDATNTLRYIGSSGLTTDTGQCVGYACGDPLANLAEIRDLFFARPGHTLGSDTLRVLSQAQLSDPRFPGDRAFVENVMWLQQGTLFVTVNVPGGSNNDADPWYQATAATPRQEAERADRTAADVRWLQAAFLAARLAGAKGVVITEQADMWDTDGKANHLGNYEPIIAAIADGATSFGRPVLLLNGDSHIYRSDNPLRQGAPCTMDDASAGAETTCAQAASDNPSLNITADAWTNHPVYDVANFHRVTIHGSTLPLEWLALTVDPGAQSPTTSMSFGPFTWERRPQPQI